MEKNMTSMNEAKFEYNLGNMKDCENQSATKKDTPKRLTFTVVFEEKSMSTFQDKKKHSKNAMTLLLLTCLMIFDDNKGRREMAHFKNVNIGMDV